MYLGSPKTSIAVGKMIEESLEGTRYASFEDLQTAAISEQDAARLYDSIRRRVASVHHEAESTTPTYNVSDLNAGRA